MRTIAFLKQIGGTINLIATVQHLNANRLEKYVQLANKLEVSLSFSIFTACFEGEMKALIPTESDIQEVSDFLIKSNLTVDDTQISGDGSVVAQCICGVGKEMIYIGADGKVYPCHILMDEAFCIGNIQDNSVMALRQNAGVFTDLSVDDIKGCSNCSVKYLCGGGCRARAYLKHKNLNAKDPYCTLFYNYYSKTAGEIIEGR